MTSRLVIFTLVVLAAAASGTVQRNGPVTAAALLAAHGRDPLADGQSGEGARQDTRPDSLWCPMHPNVRAGEPGKCPICSMELVPIPPPRIGEYRVDVTVRPASRRGGARALSLGIRHPESDEPVTELTPLHDRLLHLFVISRDLRFFAHEHPVLHGDRFELSIDLPPGAYMLLADFLPSGASPQMVPRAIVTPGYGATPFGPPPEVAEDLAAKVIDGLRVALSLETKPGRLDAVLRFRITDAASGAALHDLEPYLGASGHLLILSTDLVHAVHAHPEALSSGPEIAFDAEFPAPGVYKLWVQVQRHGRVFTAPFVVRVGASR